MEIIVNSGNYNTHLSRILKNFQFLTASKTIGFLSPVMDNSKNSDTIKGIIHNKKALVYGLLAGWGILAFYILVLTFFQSYGFALYEFKRLWIWLVPLSVGFGTQIGLYTSIRHDAALNRGIAASSSVSGGSMIACCSHYFFSIIPFIGITGLTTLTSFLMTYQKAFFSIGIASSILGIVLMLGHIENSGNKIAICPEFSKGQFGKTNDAINRIVHKKKMKEGHCH